MSKKQLELLAEYILTNFINITYCVSYLTKSIKKNDCWSYLVWTKSNQKDRLSGTV